MTQKDVFFSGLLMILQSETKTDWTLTRSLMFFSVDTLEDHKGGGLVGVVPVETFLEGGGEAIQGNTLLHTLTHTCWTWSRWSEYKIKSQNTGLKELATSLYSSCSVQVYTT